jgi:hypothetical protein
MAGKKPHIPTYDYKRLVEFATAKRPLRSSSLQKIAQCPMSVVMNFFEQDDEAGQAADTGSAMHHAAHLFHHGIPKDEAIRQMELQKETYPLANLLEARHMFHGYQLDPRNIEAKIIKIEEEVKITIPPAKEDKTKEEIVIIGHLDQIREDKLSKIWKLWDIKTGTKGGQYYINSSLYQLASYCYGATLKFKREVHPGGLILPREYLGPTTLGKILSPPKAYCYLPWTYDHIPHILNGLRYAVAAIRNGTPWVNPNPVDWCRWCPAKGIDFCIPKVKKLHGDRKDVISLL